MWRLERGNKIHTVGGTGREECEKQLEGKGGGIYQKRACREIYQKQHYKHCSEKLANQMRSLMELRHLFSTELSEDLIGYLWVEHLLHNLLHCYEYA